MKIQSIKNTGISNTRLFKLKSNPTKNNARDTFFTGRKLANKTVNYNGVIYAKKISADNFIIKRDSILEKLIHLNTNDVSISDSDIGTLQTFDKCRLFLNNSKITKIEPCEEIWVDGSSEIKEIKKAYLVLTGEDEENINIGKMTADYINLRKNTTAGTIEGHVVYANDNARIGSIFANNVVTNANNYGMESDTTVKIGKIHLIEPDIIIKSNKLDTGYIPARRMTDCETWDKNGCANLKFTEVNDIDCTHLIAKHCKIEKARVYGICELKNTFIEELRAENFGGMESVHIKKLILPDKQTQIPKGDNLVIDEIVYDN